MSKRKAHVRKKKLYNQAYFDANMNFGIVYERKIMLILPLIYF